MAPLRLGLSLLSGYKESLPYLVNNCGMCPSITHLHVQWSSNPESHLPGTSEAAVQKRRQISRASSQQSRKMVDCHSFQQSSIQSHGDVRLAGQEKLRSTRSRGAKPPEIPGSDDDEFGETAPHQAAKGGVHGQWRHLLDGYPRGRTLRTFERAPVSIK